MNVRPSRKPGENPAKVGPSEEKAVYGWTLIRFVIRHAIAVSATLLQNSHPAAFKPGGCFVVGGFNQK